MHSEEEKSSSGSSECMDVDYVKQMYEHATGSKTNDIETLYLFWKDRMKSNARRPPPEQPSFSHTEFAISATPPTAPEKGLNQKPYNCFFNEDNAPSS